MIDDEMYQWPAHIVRAMNKPLENDMKSIYDRFDEYDLEMTVKALAVLNPRAYVTEDDIKTTVSANVSDETKPNVISTSGWVASNYRCHDGEIRWRVTVMASVAVGFVTDLRKLATGE